MRRKMEKRRDIGLVNSCRSYPASYSRIDASDSGICSIQTRRRHRTFIWLDWMAPWLPVLPVTAKGNHRRGRIMYEWNGREWKGSTGTDKTFIVRRGEQSVTINAHTDTFACRAEFVRCTNESLEINQSYQLTK